MNDNSDKTKKYFAYFQDPRNTAYFRCSAHFEHLNGQNGGGRLSKVSQNDKDLSWALAHS